MAFEHLFRSIGQLIGKAGDCQKGTSKRNTKFESLGEDERERVLHRSGLLKKKEKVDSICTRHKTVFLDKFEFYQVSCCDPFNRHRKQLRKNISVIKLGTVKKLCARCRVEVGSLAKAETPCSSSVHHNPNPRQSEARYCQWGE